MHTWEKIQISKEGSDTQIVITSMPGKHTLLPDAIFDLSNKTGIHFIPPVMGSMVTFKRGGAAPEDRDYNLYISGDTLYYDELKVSMNGCVLDSN